MPLQHPRLTVRRLMVAVAMIAVFLGGAVWVRRRAEFARSRSADHRAMFFEVMHSPEAVQNFEADKRIAKYHLEWEMKWDRAASRPWLPFEAEPPAPE